MSGKDPYKTLGVPRGATGDDVRKAYRKLARMYHPDANPDDPAAEERFKEIQQAYAVLSNPEKRREYDGRSRPSSRRPSPRRQTGPSRGTGGRTTRSINLSDLLGKLADLSGDRGAGSKESSGQFRSEDVARIARLLGLDVERISKLSDAGIKVNVSFGDGRRAPGSAKEGPNDKPPRPPDTGKPRGA